MPIIVTMYLLLLYTVSIFHLETFCLVFYIVGYVICSYYTTAVPPQATKMVQRQSVFFPVTVSLDGFYELTFFITHTWGACHSQSHERMFEQRPVWCRLTSTAKGWSASPPTPSYRQLPQRTGLLRGMPTDRASLCPANRCSLTHLSQELRPQLCTVSVTVTFCGL